MGFNEIKCKNQEEANLFSNFENYFPFYKLRKEGNGGGVLILIHESLKNQCTTINFPVDINDEIVGISLKGKNQSCDLLQQTNR